MYKNILKSTTYLDVACTGSQASHEICLQLLTDCPKLTYLYFEEVPSRDNEPFTMLTEDPSCFSALKNLNSLRTLEITVYKTWHFLRDFILPPSVQDVQLRFLSFDKPTFDSTDILPIFMNFCEKWNEIKLNSLKILFNQKLDKSELVTLFLESLLQRIKSTRALSIQLTPQGVFSKFRKLFLKNRNQIDLSSFFDSIKHFGNTLESLSLLDYETRYSMKNLPEQPLTFNSLQQLILQGFMPQEGHINRLFETNLRDLTTVEDKNPLVVSLRELEFDSVESFMGFLQIFDQENFVRRPLSVDIYAYIKGSLAGNPSWKAYKKSFKLFSRNLILEFIVETKFEFLKDAHFKSEFIKSLQNLEFEEDNRAQWALVPR